MKILTAEQAAQQMIDSTIPMKDRFTVSQEDDGTWSVWNHEEARREADRDGKTRFDSQLVAHDLAEELRHS